MAFSIFRWCHHHHWSILECFHHSQKKLYAHYQLFPLTSQPYHSPPQLSPVSTDWPILDISYKWNHIICGFLCLVLFTLHNVFQIQPCCSRCQNSLIFFLKVYLFLAVLGLRLCVLSLVAVSGGYSAWASHCSGFSCGAWAPETGSAVGTQGLSCLSACGIFLDQGLNPCPLHWQVDS